MSNDEDVYTRKFGGGGASSAEQTSDHDIAAGGMTNKNTEWMESAYTWVIYVCVCACIAMCPIVTNMLSVSAATTALNIIHGVATFTFFHWIKGSPDEWSQGEWNGLTFWEQLNAGLPWTSTKKFLMVVPAVLCLIPCVLTNYDHQALLLNVPVFVVLIIAKLPAMHRVRICSINATTGIDDKLNEKHAKKFE